jgi:hypothetical protein
MKERGFDLNLRVLRGARIAIATPLLDGTCTQGYMMSIADTVRYFTKAGIDISVLACSGHGVAQARNRLVASFMAEDFTHILFIDSDHAWSPINIVRLLAMRKDVIGIVARKKTDEVQWAANIPQEETEIDEAGSMRILGEIGTGFLLIRREVLRAMMDAYPELSMKLMVEGAPEAEKRSYYRLFEFVVGADGIERSEDITFCQRWKRLGGEIWCDPSASISHFGVKDYHGCISDLFAQEDIKEESKANFG